MRHSFVSYARENKPDVEALERDLDALRYQARMDLLLRGLSDQEGADCGRQVAQMPIDRTPRHRTES